MGGQGQLVVALVGVSLLILAARGSLTTAWSALLGSAPASNPGGGAVAPTGETLCCFGSNTCICAQSSAQCAQFGGKVGNDATGYCAAGGAGRVTTTASPGPGAPGSGVTTQ